VTSDMRRHRKNTYLRYLLTYLLTTTSIYSRYFPRNLPFTARRYAMLARYMPSLCVYVCLSQVGVLSKRLNESSWLMALELPSTFHLPRRSDEMLVGPKIKVLSRRFYPKLWTQKISPRQVDGVVNKSRRRSSLLTTLTTVDAS